MSQENTPMTTTAPATTPVDPADAAARIGELRGEIDACDAAIIDLVQRRLAVSQEIGALRTASGGTRLSLSREQQVLDRFRAALGPDGAALGMLLLRQGRGRL
jgi:chorismate mutase